MKRSRCLSRLASAAGMRTAVAVLLVLPFAACGGGGASTPSQPVGTPEPTPTPAPDVSGRWAGSFVENPSATQCSVTSDLTLDLQQSGTDVTGTLQFSILSATPAPGDPCPVEAGDLFPGLTSGTVNGDIITLQLQITGGPSFVFQGTISGDRMSGTSPPDSEGPGGSWEVTRQ